MQHGWTMLLPLVAAGCVERALEPHNVCGASQSDWTVQIKNVDKVDLLFVIDNSSSMQDNQEKLREQVPRLARTLLTGSRGPDDPKPFAPVRDLRVAVVNSDMGANDVEGCSEHGADGLFQGTSCVASQPAFRSYLALPDASVDDFASDLACIADVGTGGCAREQPLEAALKALWPAADSSLEFAGDPSHGDREHAGFLRNDPLEGLSLLSVVVLSDEDDASPFPISRYVDGFSALRTGNAGLAMFSAIVNVPPDLVDADARSGVDFENSAQRDAYYDRIASDPRMQRAPETHAENSEGSPGRRYIELAKALGSRASVASIHQEDYSPALDIVSAIAGYSFESLCIPEAQLRDERGAVACNVIWELQPERLNFDTPIECSDRPELLSSLPGKADSGGKRCLVKQRPVVDGVPQPGEGWYYADSGPEVARSCTPSQPQMIAFTKAAAPPTGVTIKVQCRSQTQRADCE